MYIWRKDGSKCELESFLFKEPGRFLGSWRTICKEFWLHKSIVKQPVHKQRPLLPSQEWSTNKDRCRSKAHNCSWSAFLPFMDKLSATVVSWRRFPDVCKQHVSSSILNCFCLCLCDCLDWWDKIRTFLSIISVFFVWACFDASGQDGVPPLI